MTVDSTKGTAPGVSKNKGEKPNEGEKPAVPPAAIGALQGSIGREQTRPEGDYRSAEDIIKQSPLLKNLGNQHGANKGDPNVREALKKQVGDFEHDPDAAYRAQQVLEHIEKYDEKGNEITKPAPSGAPVEDNNDPTKAIGNGKIDGYTKSDDARPGTEAGRLQDFGKFGYDSIKGGDKPADKPGDKPADKPADAPAPPASPPTLPLESAVRPDGDNRTAGEIIDQNKTLKGLGNQEGVKDNLKKQVGDYEKDPEAAFRASQVIDYITHVDEKGEPVKRDDSNAPDDDKLNGFSKDGGKEVANHGTEAGRLKDFGKSGYDSLKGPDGKSAKELVSSLNADAIAKAVKDAGGDSKKLGKEYFTNGKTEANGADKAAAMLELSETLAKYKGGQEAYQYVGPGGEGKFSGEGLSPGQKREAFYKDVQGKIDQLAKDPDVIKFNAEKVPNALHDHVASDPRLKDELQRRFDNSSSTHALEASFGKKDDKGNPLGTTEALTDFIKGPDFYGQALDKKPDLAKAMQNAPKEIQDKVKAGYEEIVSGKDLERLQKEGKPLDKALIESGVNKATYEAVLDEKTVKEGTDKFNDVTTKLGRENLTQDKSINDMLRGLGVKDVNDPALEEIVQKNLDSIAPPGPDRPIAKDIVSFLRSMDDTGRGAAKYDDSIAKVQKEWGNKLPQNVSAAYKSGVMHAASSMLLVGSLAAGAAAGSPGSPGMVTAQSFQVAGLMTEGGAKFIADQFKRNNVPGGINLKPGDWIKDMENGGKAAGGVIGNVIGLVSGSIGAAESAAKGDKVAAGFQGTFAGLNGISATAGVTEVGAYVAGRLAGAGVAELAGLVGGIAGSVAGAAGGVAAIGGMIYGIIASVKADDKKNKEIDKWYDETQKGFDKFGVTPPDLGTTRARPEENSAPGDNLAPAPGY